MRKDFRAEWRFSLRDLAQMTTFQNWGYGRSLGDLREPLAMSMASVMVYRE